jgi:superfamily I DNA/RNA helicase/RecB family exonuclease
VLVLRRPAPFEGHGAVVLDSAQRAAVAADDVVVRVLGAPGTGKSTVAVERVVRAVRAGLSPDACLVLAPTRGLAARLRDAVTARIGGTSTTPLARSQQSFAFGVVREAAALRGEPPPRLLSGPEQDVVLRELLAGHANGETPAPPWPPTVERALSTRGFRAELRDLLMRAIELGLQPDDLAHLGVAHARAEWVAAAHVFREYDQVTALAAPNAHDPAWLLRAAAEYLEEDDEALARLRARVRLVVVDDAQELTPAGRRLLDVVAGRGAVSLVLIGDPDAATQTFRGAEPGLFIQAWPDARRVVLGRGHRCGGAVASAAAAVVGHVGVIGGGVQRRAVLAAANNSGIPEQQTARSVAVPSAGAVGSSEAVEESGAVEVHLLRTAAQEAAFVAGVLRRAHLEEGLGWSRMAVVVRGGARTATVRRALTAAGVPLSTGSAELPVRDEAAVRPFLEVLGLALEVRSGAESLAPQVVADVLGSPVGGADAVSLRRLRRALRRVELGDGGGRPSDTLLAEVVLTPAALDRVGPEAASARRVHRVLAAALDQLRDGADIEQVMWAMWHASGLATRWRQAALAGGPSGRRADRDLDAILALFDAAARFTDRLPGSRPADFLEHVRGQDLPGDTLARRAPAGESVVLATPAAAAGREWDLVVVAGVQDGHWPDLRLRGSLLGTGELGDVVAGAGGTGGVLDARAARVRVRHDETRLFYVAMTRARHRLVVTAVRSEDEQPSPYLEVVDPGTAARAFTDVPRPPTLAGLVAELRRSLGGTDDPATRGAAATVLAGLARAEVPGADPAQWWALRDVSDRRPRRPDGIRIGVAPSALDGFARCQLQWVLRASGGHGPSLGAQDVGVLVHEVAHTLGDTGVAEYAAEVERRWGRLGLPPGWLSRRELARATAMTARLAGHIREAGERGWRRAASEERIRVALGTAVVTGVVDRIEVAPDGRVRVIDLKTGSSKPTVAEIRRHGQLGAYQVAVEAGAFAAHGGRSGGAALLQLGRAAGVSTTLQEQPPLTADDDPGWAADLVESAAVAMRGAVFPATPGPHCATCSVATSCPAAPEGRR